MFIKNNKGFTLAEVLITLLIIGVIASIVIPGLIADTQQAEYKTAWKKAYADLSQSTARIVADNGGSLKGLFTNDNSVRNNYSAYLSYTKSCDYPNNFGNCWHKMDGDCKNLKGTANSGWGSGSGLILNNGSLVRFRFNQSDCNDTSYTVPICGHIIIDINGFKSPNVTGKDIFAVYIQENTIKPWGTIGDSYQNDCKNMTGGIPGLGCSAEYLYQ
jgi:prepilin-type N-terminal cleavage/methylation domain-containing protein